MSANPPQRFLDYDLLRRLRVDDEGETWLARRGAGEATPLLLETGASKRHFVTRLVWQTGLDHPNVLPLLDYGLAGGELTERHQRRNHFGVWAWPGGPSVARLARRTREAGQRVPPGVVARIGADIARAIAHLHEVHEMPCGELDASRIYISPSGVTRVSHFAGDPRDLGIQLRRARYFSPEHIRGVPLRPESDVFSLGLLLFELSTGRRALRTRSLEWLVLSLVVEPRPSPSDLEPELPWSFDRVVDRATALARGERYESMAAFADALEALAKTLEDAGEPCDVAAFAHATCRRDFARMERWGRAVTTSG